MSPENVDKPVFAPSVRWSIWLLVAGLIVGATYAGAWDNGYHFDDGHSIRDNAAIRDLSNVGRFFTDVSSFSPLAENRSYRPLLLVSFALSHALGGGEVWAYHLASQLFHVMAAVAIGWLLFVLGAAAHPAPWAFLWSVFGVAVFAAHPLLSEAVNYVSAQSSLMAAALMFVSIGLFIQFRVDGRRMFAWGSLLVFSAALMTKLIAITVPGVLVAYVILFEAQQRRSSASVWRWIGAFAAVAGGFVLLHEWMIGNTARASRSMVPPLHYLWTETRVWLRFVGLAVWPEGLCADLTMRWNESPWEGAVARALIVHGCVVVAALRFRKSFPGVAFGVAWYYMTLSPTNSFIPLSEPATEHRVYVALPGLLIAAVSLAAPRVFAWPRLRRRLLASVGVLAVVALGVVTWNRNKVWRDDHSLWSSVIACAPDNGRAHLNFGRALMAAGDLVSARREFDACASMWSGYAYCYVNRAVLSLHEERLDAAARDSETALRLLPNNVYTNHWRGEVLRKQGQPAGAIPFFERALSQSPDFAESVLSLGLARFELGDFEAAVQALDRANAMGRTNAEAWFARGFLAEKAGDASVAERAYRLSLQIDAGQVRARYNLAVLLHKNGRLDEAIAQYAVLRQSGTSTPDALFNHALALKDKGRLEEMAAVRSELERAAPSYPRLSELR